MRKVERFADKLRTIRDSMDPRGGEYLYTIRRRVRALRLTGAIAKVNWLAGTPVPAERVWIDVFVLLELTLV